MWAAVHVFDQCIWDGPRCSIRHACLAYSGAPACITHLAVGIALISHARSATDQLADRAEQIIGVCHSTPCQMMICGAHHTT